MPWVNSEMFSLLGVAEVPFSYTENNWTLCSFDCFLSENEAGRSGGVTQKEFTKACRGNLILASKRSRTHWTPPPCEEIREVCPGSKCVLHWSSLAETGWRGEVVQHTWSVFGWTFFTVSQSQNDSLDQYAITHNSLSHLFCILSVLILMYLFCKFSHPYRPISTFYLLLLV